MAKAVRDLDGKWKNTELFREAGNHFLKHGFYCSHPWGSQLWYDHWLEERKRSIEGYTIGKVSITGDHYFYLNYCPILKVDEIIGNRSKKVKSFPDFWDGDYNYFWLREISRNGVGLNPADFPDEETKHKAFSKAYKDLGLFVNVEPQYLEGGWNFIVGKSRRKGYSYKAAAIGAKNYFTKPNSLTIYAAYDKKYLYPKGIFGMAVDNINFINTHTAWVMPSDVVNKPNSGHLRASYIQYSNGVKMERGFMSELIALTFNDNPDAARGKDAEDVFFEESGVFGAPGLLKQAYAATQDVVMAGAIKTGMITIFGTSGDIEGGTADYADMYMRPKAFDLLPIKNTYKEGNEDFDVGFFHPVNWNMEGFYDKDGNSDKDGAKELELDLRKKLIANGASSTDIQKRMQEKPLDPDEAFYATNFNNFPTVELKLQLKKVLANNWQNTKGTPVDLVYEEGKIKAKLILDGKAEPITSLHNPPKNKNGCPVIYEYPVPNTPRGLYKIGYDPVRQDLGTSLAAIIVYKGVHIGTQHHNIIVAEYIGRKELADEIDRIAEKLADFYNTTIMHENEVTGVKNYFRRIKRLNLLAAQPDAVISKSIKNSKVARVYGCHMTLQLKDAGERYVKDWLLTVLDYDEHGGPIRVIDKIYSVRLLEELIAYNRKGNFDLISALFMCMFQVQEEEVDKKYDKKTENKSAKKLISMIDNMYIKSKFA